MTDLISVIIPCKNGSNYLVEALEGIKKQNMPVEIIVVDDGSIDNTGDIAKSFGAKVIRNEISQGPVRGKNIALKQSTGNFIMFHDHDDVMIDGALRKLYQYLNDHSDISAVEAKVKDFISPELPDEEKKQISIRLDPYYGLFTGAILMRKEVWDALKEFDTSVTAGEILDWNAKMRQNNFRIEKIDFVSCNRRNHSTNFGRKNQKKEMKDYASLLRKKMKNNDIDLASGIVDLFRSTSFKKDHDKITEIEHKNNVDLFLKNLSGNAYEHANNLVKKLEKLYQKNMLPISEIYSNNELEDLKKVKEFEKQIVKTENGYKWKHFLLPIKLFESSVFLYKHGIEYLRQDVGNKAIIDAGGYIADSVLVFRDKYPNAPIYSFEPTIKNFELALQTIKLNKVHNVQMINYGLGDKEDILKIKTFDTSFKNIESTICENGNEDVKITTIDKFVQDNNLRVGLIKTDVEGFEQNLLKGAKQTICEQKPVLLISIYHNYNDFYKIKPLIESWNLGYSFDVFQGVQNSGDITVETLLIAEMMS